MLFWQSVLYVYMAIGKLDYSPGNQKALCELFKDAVIDQGATVQVE